MQIQHADPRTGTMTWEPPEEIAERIESLRGKPVEDMPGWKTVEQFERAARSNLESFAAFMVSYHMVPFHEQLLLDRVYDDFCEGIVGILRRE